jgi:6,7-dimethyl-8-ribityllumazine synthase
VSGAGAPGLAARGLAVDGAGMTVEIVAASWHGEIMDGLVAGAIGACEAAGAEYRVTRVPGCFEIPVVAQALAARVAPKAREGQGAARPRDGDGAAGPRGERAPVAIVGLGVVIRGDTPHFEYVCESVTRGLTDVARINAIAVGFGILTCDDEAQAMARAGLPGSKESKGAEAAEAAIATARILENLS